MKQLMGLGNSQGVGSRTRSHTKSGLMFSKGRDLYEMMLANDAKAGAMMTPPRASAGSPFLEVDDLKEWGYEMAVREDWMSEIYATWSDISLVLDLIGLNSSFAEDSDNYPLEHMHIGRTVHDGKVYHPTDALYCQVINPHTGLMVAYDLKSPDMALQGAGSMHRSAPDLKHYSDVAFLQWKSQAVQGSSLKYVLHYHVVNLHTNLVVRTILDSHGAGNCKWPGITVTSSSDEGQSLLGTPNGSGVAFLLLQHKAQLGHKTVDSMTIFWHGNDLMLLFNVVDIVGIDDRLSSRL